MHSSVKMRFIHSSVKILERIIASQLVAYFDAYDLLPAHQSGFRRNHSTEILLVRLLSDLHCAMDAGHVSLLDLFGVSSAFDSVDYSILLQRLSTSFGLTDKPLEWLRSFLSERTNCATFGSSRSAWVHAPFGVPQGSVLGPLLYIIYTADIGALLSSHGLLHQLYADDVQAYTRCTPDCAVTMVRQLCLAMDFLSGCLASNRLLLNPTKTQFIWLGSLRRLANVDRCLVAQTFPHLVFCDNVRDLEIILDQELNFSAHINQLTHSCYYQLHHLRTVSRSLSHDTAATLVHAFVTSRLDHCCSVLVGLPLTLTAHLDRVLRSAARLIGGVPKFATISGYMRDTLHWLPIRQRIFYRVAVLVWHCFIGVAPVYLQELCRPESTLVGHHALRSSCGGKLLVPRVNTSTMQRLVFSVVASSIWNSLPSQIRLLPKSYTPLVYKLLKTDLFHRGWTGSASE